MVKKQKAIGSVSTILIVSFLIFIIAAMVLYSGNFLPSYKYQIPQNTGDGWQTARLDEVGLDKRKLFNLMNRVNRGKYENLHSVLIVKNDKLVFEEYFDGYKFDWEGEQFRGEFTEYNIDTIHNLASVTKAFTSGLIGIAIKQGFIENVDRQVMSFFPEYTNLSDEVKNRITVEHLLTMTSGLDWNEMDVPIDSRDLSNDLIQLFIVSEPIEYILAKPVVVEPGTRWYYSGGDVELLGEIIRKASGLRIDDFANEYLFEPLGISEVEWSFINQDIVQASGSNYLRPRDVAKFGSLFLNEGVWNEKQILSKEWVENTMQEHISYSHPSWSDFFGDKYGYQWWIKKYTTNSGTFNAVLRDGWGGQKIILFPDLDMMVIFTGGYYVERDPANDIITTYILPALKD